MTTSTTFQPALFHISDVLTMLTGVVLCSLEHSPRLPNGASASAREGVFYGILDITEYMTGHDLGRGGRNHESVSKVYEAAKSTIPYLKEAYPELAKIQYPDNIHTQQQMDDWVAAQASKFGEWLPVYTIPEYALMQQPSRHAAKHQKRNLLEPDGSGFGKSSA